MFKVGETITVTGVPYKDNSKMKGVWKELQISFRWPRDLNVG